MSGLRLLPRVSWIAINRLLVSTINRRIFDSYVVKCMGDIYVYNFLKINLSLKVYCVYVLCIYEN